MTSMLDFYRQHWISPVAQDISDLPAHFARRGALYRSLGLPPMAIRGKDVLEIGPGGGENALYLFSLEPDGYLALEPNPAAAEQLRNRLPAGAGIIEKSIEEFQEHSPAFSFDVVICEGLLGLCGGNPHQLLEAVAQRVVPGGVLVITCIDAISNHAEVLRRAMAHPLIDRSAPLSDQVAALRPVFAPHLATLKGMTRSVDDWIIDNLLNTASIGPTFSVPDACEALDGRFDVYGCSPPGLLPDWDWYKEKPSGNQWAIDAYWTQAHNLYDKRVVQRSRRRAANEDLMARCLRVRAQVREYERGGPQPEERLVDIGWFGRGQQYLSFVKR